MRSLTSQGHDLAQLRRAIASGNATVAMAAATGVPIVPLADALALCLLLRDEDPERYRRAAVRWHARLCRELRDLTLEESQLALAALGGLCSPGADAAAEALARLCEHHGLGEAADALERWRTR